MLIGRSFGNENSEVETDEVEVAISEVRVLGLLISEKEGFLWSRRRKCRL